jgi:hypothetical protein
MRTRNMFIMIWGILLNQRHALILLDFGECDRFIINFTSSTKCIALSVLYKLLVYSKLRRKLKKNIKNQLKRNTVWRKKQIFFFGFDVHVTVHRAKLLIIKPTWCIDFSKLLFWKENLYVSDSSSVHHQEFFTVHTAMVYVIQVCRQLESRIRMFHPDPARKLSANLCDVKHCCVYSGKLLTMDRGTVRNM